MLNKRYSDYIEISPTFESVVDIDADSRNVNLWREYIVGDDMEKNDGGALPVVEQ